MDYILIGILSIIVFGLRSTVMDMYDRVYVIEQELKKRKADESI